MTDQPIEPIRRATLSTMVTERLRELVVNGTYAPGAQLSEVELARRFGVSRGPIRESLQRLVQEGLLRSEQHRGVFIPTMSEDDIADIYVAREAIEGAAVRQAMAAGQGKALAAKLRGLVDEMAKAAKAGRWVGVADADMRFHSELVAAADSARLSRMFSTLVDETRVLLALHTALPSRVDAVAEHASIVTALEADDPDAIAAALEVHFTQSRDQMRRRLDGSNGGGTAAD